jgi:mRNA interferase HigB
LGTFIKVVNLRIISRGTLREFWDKHKDCEGALKSWYREANAAHWRGPNDIKRNYPSASFLKDNRVVFNIRGNKYRLVVRINYDYGIAWIRFVGTHATYNKIDAHKI